MTKRGSVSLVVVARASVFEAEARAMLLAPCRKSVVHHLDRPEDRPRGGRRHTQQAAPERPPFAPLRKTGRGSRWSDPYLGPILRAQQSASALATWQDPETAAARRKRYRAIVAGTEYGSLALAARALGVTKFALPQLRGKLLANGGCGRLGPHEVQLVEARPNRPDSPTESLQGQMRPQLVLDRLDGSA